MHVLHEWDPFRSSRAVYIIRHPVVAQYDGISPGFGLSPLHVILLRAQFAYALSPQMATTMVHGASRVGAR